MAQGPGDLVDVAYGNYAHLMKRADKARYLGGISIKGFGIPSQFLGLDLRTGSQKADQQRPQPYLDAMLKLIKEMDKVLEIASAQAQNTAR